MNQQTIERLNGLINKLANTIDLIDQIKIDIDDACFYDEDEIDFINLLDKLDDVSRITPIINKTRKHIDPDLTFKTKNTIDLISKSSLTPDFIVDNIHYFDEIVTYFENGNKGELTLPLKLENLFDNFFILYKSSVIIDYCEVNCVFERWYKR